jgi:hypothetical protein
VAKATRLGDVLDNEAGIDGGPAAVRPVLGRPVDHRAKGRAAIGGALHGRLLAATPPRARTGARAGWGTWTRSWGTEVLGIPSLTTCSLGRVCLGPVSLGKRPTQPEHAAPTRRPRQGQAAFGAASMRAPP